MWLSASVVGFIVILAFVCAPDFGAARIGPECAALFDAVRL
jgi:hypothetical protein